MTQSLGRFEGVTKRFGAVTAIDAVDLDLAQGEVFALLGPSGCGKTTLMRLLAGFEAPETGRIMLDGADIADLPPHRRPCSMMFQTYALFPHLSVAQNIGFGLRQQRWDKARATARVQEMLALVRLDGLDSRRPHQLSGGQKQRVALARALAVEPKIVLLDEPLAALDRRLREDTQLELKAIQRRLGVTFMIVTHDQDEAMAVADRMAAGSSRSALRATSTSGRPIASSPSSSARRTCFPRARASRSSAQSGFSFPRRRRPEPSPCGSSTSPISAAARALTSGPRPARR